MKNEDKYILVYQKLVALRKRNQYSKIEVQPQDSKGQRCGIIPPNILIKLLDICPVGDGTLYENLVMDSFAKILSGIVDSTLARQQIPIKGGFCDIEFPICTEVVDKYPLWDKWCDQYKVTSILVEVKNMKKKASFENVSQLEGYLTVGEWGHLGILVSRNGFTKGAVSAVSSLAKNSMLILPICHEDMKLLLEFSMQNSLKVMTFLRRKGNLLLRLK